MTPKNAQQTTHNMSITSTQPELDIQPRKRTPLMLAPTKQPSAVSSGMGLSVPQMSAPAVGASSQFVMVPPHMMFPASMPIHPAALGSYQSYGSNLLRQVSAATPGGHQMIYPGFTPGYAQTGYPVGYAQAGYPGGGMMMAAPRAPARHMMPSDENSDLAIERAVVDWMESVLGEFKPGQASLHQWLRTGEVLCKLANIILNASPNPNIRITQIARSSDTVLQQRENGRRFVDICRSLGVSEQDCFVPGDLYDGANMKAVTNCVYCLGGILQNYEWWITSGYSQLGRRLKIRTTKRV
jgi:hypothetical protein